MIEIPDGIWIAPEHVTMIKPIEDDECLLFFVGQSALEGHVIHLPANDMKVIVNYALGIESDDDEDEDGNDDSDE